MFSCRRPEPADSALSNSAAGITGSCVRQRVGRRQPHAPDPSPQPADVLTQQPCMAHDLRPAWEHRVRRASTCGGAAHSSWSSSSFSGWSPLRPRADRAERSFSVFKEPLFPFVYAKVGVNNFVESLPQHLSARKESRQSTSFILFAEANVPKNSQE
jgi:hypothetical protein